MVPTIVHLQFITRKSCNKEPCSSYNSVVTFRKDMVDKLNKLTATLYYIPCEISLKKRTYYTYSSYVKKENTKPIIKRKSTYSFVRHIIFGALSFRQYMCVILNILELLLFPFILIGIDIFSIIYS